LLGRARLTDRQDRQPRGERSDLHAAENSKRRAKREIVEVTGENS
jgi:hypothetical protein